MTKFVLGALALAASSTPCLAGSDSAWLAVDRDIQSLATNLAPAASGATVNGFLRASYLAANNVGDDGYGGGVDIGGFSMDDVRLRFSGNVGNYGVYIALEGSDDTDLGILAETGAAGTVGVLDAYATFPVTGEIRGQIGTFRSPLLASSNREEDTMLFIDRSVLGHWFADRDAGVMFSGNFDQLGFMFSLQNGYDGAGNDLLWGARVQFTAMGHANTQEGSYGATEENCLTIGAGFQDDQNLTDGQVMALDVNFTMGALSAMAEMVDQDKDIYGVTGTSDNTPWDIALGWMISPDQWEIAVRYEDFDDDDNSTAITGGLNWYQSGHAAKWQLNYSTIASDWTEIEVDVLQIGLCVSI